MMKSGPVTPEITRVINAPFRMRWQKLPYLTNYWTDLHQRFSVWWMYVLGLQNLHKFRGSPVDVAMVTD